MTDDLKSFKKDWQRWSSAEKLVAVTVVLVITAILGGPATLGLL